MESSLKDRNRKRRRRVVRVRKVVFGTAERPRLTVFRSNRHLSAQIIDDEKGITLVGIDSKMKIFKEKGVGKSKESARIIGAEIGVLAREKNILSVVFDRRFRKFHGVIAEFASAARATGLHF